jgi:predicted MPP superfamily phosphohydrolase
MKIKFIGLSILFLSCSVLATEKPITVLTVGDIAYCERDKEIGVKSVSNLVSKNNFDFFFPLGDLVYEEGTQKKLEKCYGKYFGKIKNKTFPTVGNHEYYADKATPYFEYFANNQDLVKKQEQNSYHQITNGFYNYYSFNKNNWSFIFLDTNLENEDNREQIIWLENILKNKKTCTIISMHHPYISSGLRPIKSSVKELMKVINKSPPTIILSGHDHHFQESKMINKTKHFVVGTGGVPISNKVNPFNLDVKNSYFDFGILKLELYNNSYSYSFVTQQQKLFSSSNQCEE